MTTSIADIVLLLYGVVTALLGVLAVFAFALLHTMKRVRRIERALDIDGLYDGNRR